MTWWAWLLVAAMVGTMAWGSVNLVLTWSWLRRMRPTFKAYHEKELRRWLRFHGGLRRC